jgi:hypothetical protein
LMSTCAGSFVLKSEQFRILKSQHNGVANVEERGQREGWADEELE